MPNANIFQHTSFFTLEKAQKKRVRRYVDQTKPSTLPTFNKLFENQGDISVMVDYWDSRINAIYQFLPYPAGFKDMDPKQRMMLEEELLFAFYVFCARYQLDHAEGRGYDADDEDRRKQLEKCAYLINLLRSSSRKNKKPDVYPLILNKLTPINDDGIRSGVKKMCSFNESRLYWVWAGRGGLLGVMIDLLPDNFTNKIQALEVLDIPVPFTTFLSWGLYYFRFAIRVGGILRHTIGGSEQEKTIPWQRRLAIQLDQCKFDLMNDFFWASANLVCAFWLYGSAIADYYAGLLTAVLLLMDVSLTIWAYLEAKGHYDLDPAPQTRMKRQCKLDLDYTLYAMYVDIMYAIALLVAFSLIYGFFFSPAMISVATALILNVTGTVLCFTLNACSVAVKQVLDVCKSIEQLNFTIADYSHANDHFDKSFLFSELRYYEKMVEYKQVCMLRSVLIDLLVPPVVFLALVFMPLSIGITVLAASFMLAVASHDYIEKYYQHGMDCLPEYQPDHQLPTDLSSPWAGGFFGARANDLHKQRESAEETPLIANQSSLL